MEGMKIEEKGKKGERIEKREIGGEEGYTPIVDRLKACNP